ncbi:Transcriptional regulator, XRE family [Modestobacter italicus]|uniref:Transcriptional regulator, XRE family n=1 Tax=Modestobacter italicus (strain DSM 44449 / CECT 9708 / BC 501) TaxID=2732864 RepID=I4ERM8_MODI5|nr:helix-turn-helix transcriptional regulator [Modestobacter marinus]CCH86041.1 Transcriptional regulator, XRE family [Modestobacter marinus]
MDAFPLAGVLRRIRRLTDCSQRELAERIGISKTAVAAAEHGTRDLAVSVLVRAAATAGCRLAVLGPSGLELGPMSGDTVRDGADRLMPAHLDTRHGDDDWWGGPHRPGLVNPRYTFDRDRSLRDRRRGVDLPADHHRPEDGDSLAERAAARRAEAVRREAARRLERHQAWRAAGSPPSADWEVDCTCPAGCEYDEERNPDRLHAPDCACGCDVD